MPIKSQDIAKPRASRRLRAAAAMLLCALPVAGCTAGFKGRSDPPSQIAVQDFNRSEFAALIEQSLRDAAQAEAYYCLAKPWSCGEDVFGRRPELPSETVVLGGPTLVELRNDYINAMTSAHKLALEDYARALTVEGATSSFLAHLGELGLNVAAGISRVQETSRVLNALAVGVIGLDENYDKEVLLGNAIPVLLDKMRAAQINEIAKIVNRTGQSLEAYPLSAARADVLNLSAVVNIETAIQALAKDAKDDRNKAERDLQEARTTAYCESAFTERLAAWFDNDDPDVMAARIALGTGFLSAQGIDLTVAEFVADCTQASKHLAMIGELGIE